MTRNPNPCIHTHLPIVNAKARDLKLAWMYDNQHDKNRNWSRDLCHDADWVAGLGLDLNLGSSMRSVYSRGDKRRHDLGLSLLDVSVDASCNGERRCK